MPPYNPALNIDCWIAAFYYNLLNPLWRLFILTTGLRNKLLYPWNAPVVKQGRLGESYGERVTQESFFLLFSTKMHFLKIFDKFLFYNFLNRVNFFFFQTICFVHKILLSNPQSESKIKSKQVKLTYINTHTLMFKLKITVLRRFVCFLLKRKCERFFLGDLFFFI